MTPEERQLITQLFDRIKEVQQTPRDEEAEALVASEVKKLPSAPYYLAQAVIIQEKGLEAAQARIQELEARVEELEAEQRPSSRGTQGSGQQGSFLGGFGSIFGGRHPKERMEPRVDERPYARSPGGWQGTTGPADTPSAGPWGPRPGYGNNGGGSFLQGALSTAAGVAGGVLIADAMRGLFSTHTGGFGNMLGLPSDEVRSPVEETVINNYYGDDTAPLEPGFQSDDGTLGDNANFDDGAPQEPSFADADWGSDFGDGGSFDDDSFDI